MADKTNPLNEMFYKQVFNFLDMKILKALHQYILFIWTYNSFIFLLDYSNSLEANEMPYNNTGIYFCSALLADIKPGSVEKYDNPYIHLLLISY